MGQSIAPNVYTVEHSNRGSAIIEAALVLPLLFLLFAGLYDGFYAIQTYSTLSEVGQEAVRYASRVPTLEPGTHPSGTGITTTPPPGHLSVHARIRGIIASKPWHVRLSSLDIVTQLQDSTGTGITAELGGNDPTLEGVIMIRITGAYRASFLSFLFGNLVIQVTVASEHL